MGAPPSAEAVRGLMGAGDATWGVLLHFAACQACHLRWQLGQAPCCCLSPPSPPSCPRRLLSSSPACAQGGGAELPGRRAVRGGCQAQHRQGRRLPPAAAPQRPRPGLRHERGRPGARRLAAGRRRRAAAPQPVAGCAAPRRAVPPRCPAAAAGMGRALRRQHGAPSAGGLHTALRLLAPARLLPRPWPGPARAAKTNHPHTTPSAGEFKEASRGVGAVKGMSFSGDGRLLALGGEDGSIEVWEWPAMRRRLRCARSRLSVLLCLIKAGLAASRRGSGPPPCGAASGAPATARRPAGQPGAAGAAGGEPVLRGVHRRPCRPCPPACPLPAGGRPAPRRSGTSTSRPPTPTACWQPATRAAPAGCGAPTAGS